MDSSPDPAQPGGLLPLGRVAGLRRRFRYHAWATARVADALVEASGETAALRPFAHALVADRVWLLRLRGEPDDGVALWPALDAAGCLALARRNADAWHAVLAPGGEPLPDAGLDASVAYHNRRGEPVETAVADILDHVLLHAAYHRGQAVAALRAADLVPPSTDFVLWLRLGSPSRLAGEPAPDAR